jgi:raffinose/stachyose/melibiose transport system permease protein
MLSNGVALPVLLVVAFVWLYPFLWVIATSFKQPLEIYTDPGSLWPAQWTIANYQRAWSKGGFDAYFWNTVLYTSATTLLELAKAALAGYVLARFSFPGRDLLYRLVILTLFAPVTSILIPQYVLIDALGLMNSRVGVILAMSGGGGALYTLFFVNFFEGLPQELFDAAEIDGAKMFQTFFLVLPLARPVVAMVVILSSMSAWNEFTIPLVFTLSRPELQSLAVGLLTFRGTESTDWTGFAAGVCMSILPIMALFYVFQGYFIRGLAGALKG